MNKVEEQVQNGVVVVDFYADWCGPCKMLAPILEELVEDRSDVKVVKINIDEEPELAKQYGVMSIPTLLLFNEGEQKAQQVGFMPKELLTRWINDNK